MRGVAFVGILCALAESYGFDFWSPRRNIRACVGTSIGALFAALVAARTTPSEFATLVRSESVHSAVKANVFNLFSKWGFDDGAALRKFVEAKLVAKTGISEISLAQFRAFTGVEFATVATALDTNRAIFLSHATYPHLPVCDAVVMSMSLPPVFAPRKLGTRLVVDGGLRNNFPVNFSGLTSASKTLAMKVEWTNAFTLNSWDMYVSRVVYCALESAEEARWAECSEVQKRNTISCDMGNISAINFSYSQDQLDCMVQAGAAAAEDFVRARFFPPTKKTEL